MPATGLPPFAAVATRTRAAVVLDLNSAFGILEEVGHYPELAFSDSLLPFVRVGVNLDNTLDQPADLGGRKGGKR